EDTPGTAHGRRPRRPPGHLQALTRTEHRATRNHPVTTITPDPGNQHPSRTSPTRHPPPPPPDRAARGPHFSSPAGAPGTLTAVPHADQSQSTQKGHPVTYPGPPRPVQVSATPLAELAGQLGTPAPERTAEVTGITHDSRA